MRHGARQVEKIPGVFAGIMPARQNDLVASLFRQTGKSALQPPGGWMEPEESAVQERKPLHERIATPDVLAFVREDGVELCRRPLPPVFRKDHHWMEESHRDRRGAGRADAHAAFCAGLPG